MNAKNFFLLLLAVATLAIAGCGKSDSHAGHEASGAAKYHCPMHPTYVSDRPGDCPICGMKLVPIGDDKAGNGSTNSIPGRVSISLSPEKQQLIGLTSSPVQR